MMIHTRMRRHALHKFTCVFDHLMSHRCRNPMFRIVRTNMIDKFFLPCLAPHLGITFWHRYTCFCLFLQPSSISIMIRMVVCKPDVCNRFRFDMLLPHFLRRFMMYAGVHDDPPLFSLTDETVDVIESEW